MITINDDKNEPSRGSLAIRLAKSSEEVERLQRIRYGRYVEAWRERPFQMYVALFVQLIISFLAILTASGPFQPIPTFVSFLYLIYIFSSSKTGNTVGMLKDYLEDIKEKYKEEGLCGALCFVFVITVIWLPILIPSFIILDLVQVHRFSASPQTLSFATADMVVIIASINFASRAYSLSNAIPLLVSFDFITKFSSEIVKGVAIEDVDAIKKADENLEWIREKWFLRVLLPTVLMIGIVITALVLASLSIAINDYFPQN